MRISHSGAVGGEIAGNVAPSRGAGKEGRQEYQHLRGDKVVTSQSQLNLLRSKDRDRGTHEL